MTMTVSADGSVYFAITVNPAGTPFPATSGAFQTKPPTTSKGQVVPVVGKLNASGSALVYSTYLAGSGRMNLLEDAVEGIAADSAGDVFVVGQTISSDFPVTPGAFQTRNLNSGQGTTGFVTELNPEGSGLIYSTYLGGSRNDFALAVKVDSQGGAIVLGQTNSTDFPTTEMLFPFSSDGGFIVRVLPGGSSLAYSTFLPAATGLDLDSAGNAYVAGVDSSASSPVFVARIAPNGQLSGTENLGGPAMQPEGGRYRQCNNRRRGAEWFRCNRRNCRVIRLSRNHRPDSSRRFCLRRQLLYERDDHERGKLRGGRGGAGRDHRNSRLRISVSGRREYVSGFERQATVQLRRPSRPVR